METITILNVYFIDLHLIVVIDKDKKKVNDRVSYRNYII